MSAVLEEVCVVVPGKLVRNEQDEVISIRCVCTNHPYRDGMLHTRIVDFRNRRFKCKQCRRWVRLPDRMA